MARKQPKLFLLGTTLDCFGVWELQVKLNEKVYTYSIGSEYAVNKFLTYYKRGQFDRAVSVLNHFRIKPFLNEKGEEI